MNNDYWDSHSTPDNPIKCPVNGKDAVLYNAGNRPIYYGFGSQLGEHNGIAINPGKWARFGQSEDNQMYLTDLHVYSYSTQSLIIMWLEPGVEFHHNG